MAAHCVHAADVRTLSDFDFETEEWPELFVLDYADDWGRLNLASHLVKTRTIHRRLLTNGYAVNAARGPVAVLERSDEEAIASATPDVPAEAVMPTPMPVGPGLSLVGWRIRDYRGPERGRRYGRLRIDAYVRVESTPRVDLGIGLALVDAERGTASVSASSVRPAGGMSSSSLNWLPGTLIHEAHETAWALPQQPQRGRFKLRVDLYDLSTGAMFEPVVCD
jgi:hypothetical protein